MTRVLQAVFLFLLFVALPRSSWRSRRMLDSGAGASISRMRIYVSTMASMFFIGLITFQTAYASDIVLFPRLAITGRILLVTVAALALKLGFGLWRLRSGRVLARTARLAPQSPRERILAVLLLAETAVVEECAYRGVAFILLTGYTGSPWLGAILSAVAFGLAHILQGGEAAVVAGGHGLVDQGVVALTGSLYPMMVIHFLYDAIFGAVLANQKLKPETRNQKPEIKPEADGGLEFELRDRRT